MNKPSLAPRTSTITGYNLMYSDSHTKDIFSQWIETDIYLVQLMSEVANRHVHTACTLVGWKGSPYV